MLTDGLTDAQKLQLATYGTLDDVWRIYAYFLHLTAGPMIDGTCDTKWDVYARVGELLMCEGIQRIVVQKNGEVQQAITIA